nr:hypothetical protein [Sphingobium sp. WCS2017Hpa-17]
MKRYGNWRVGLDSMKLMNDSKRLASVWSTLDWLKAKIRPPAQEVRRDQEGKAALQRQIGPRQVH